MSPKPFHLGLYSMLPVTHHSMATWRHPRNIDHTGRNYAFDRPDVWIYVGQLAERAKFDFIFSADTEGIYSDYRQSYKYAVQYAAQVPCFDETILLSFIAAHTNKIGIVSTLSTNGHPPYITARKFATLDHLTGGRSGWNVVTAFHKRAAENLGFDDQTPHDERYDKADEYMEVCYQLWDSWDTDAVIMDVEREMFADPEKVHEINFQGKWFRSRGPLNVHRCPQGKPLIVQAGSSERGIKFAARHAELVFGIQPFREGMKRYHDALKGAMAADWQRDPNTCKICFGFQPIVGETEEIALTKAALHNKLVPMEAGMTIFSGHTGYDFSQHDPEALLSDLDIQVPGIQGLIDMYTKVSEGKASTLADIARAHGRGVGTPQVVGTGEQVADWMEETMDFVGGDGFMLSPAYLPGALEDFVDLVIPVLQRRGLVRTDYLEEGMLRENLLAF